MSLCVGHLDDIIANYYVLKQYRLHPSVDPKVIAEAAAAGIIGVKDVPSR